jgi:cytochrome P450
VIPAHELVMISLLSANRDEARFAAPGQLNIRGLHTLPVRLG